MDKIDRLFGIARHRGKKHPAIICGRKEVSFALLLKQVSYLADSLEDGLCHGSRVALLTHDSTLFCPAFLALIKLGCVVIPLNPKYKSDEIRRYLKDASIQHVLCDRQLAVSHEEVFKETEIIVTIINLPENPLCEYTGRGSKLKSDFEALRQFSSGSTARPKLVSRSYSNLFSEAKNVVKTLGIKDKDKILCLVPLHHAYGLGTGLTPALFSGATIVFVGTLKPREVLKAIEREKISIILGVPPMFRILSEQAGKRKRLKSLRYCFSAGISLPNEVSRRFKDRFGIYVRELYGTTETGCIGANLNKDVGKSLSSAGRPICGTKISVVLKDGRFARPGEEGQILIKSPTCGKWYVERNKKTPLFKNGFFHTADIGRLDKGKNLFILGRESSFINVAGEKVDPREVEEVIKGNPLVREAVVLSSPDVLRGEVVKAVVVPKDGSLKEIELLRYCRERLTDFKVPRILVFKDFIPKSPLGKILKGLL